MGVEIYLNFNGNSREVIHFYADVFGKEVPKIMAFGDNPPNPEYPLPEEARDLVMHSRLNVLGNYIMFSDVFPGMPFTPGNNFSLSVVTDDEELLTSAFNKLQDGGTVDMDLQETFWSKKYGRLTDKFGIIWQFNLGLSDY